DLIDDLYDIGAGLALYREHDAALAVVPGGYLVRLHAVDDLAEVGEAHRRAVAVGDDERPVGGGIGELAARGEAVGPVLAIERTDGQVRIVLVERLLHLVQTDAA